MGRLLILLLLALLGASVVIMVSIAQAPFVAGMSVGAVVCLAIVFAIHALLVDE